MKLTEEQLEGLRPRLDRYFRRLGDCRVCGDRKWQVMTKLFELREFHGGDLYVGDSLLPVLPLTCGNCGNTHFLNAVVLGLVEPEEEEEEAQETAGPAASESSDVE